ncbi:MAG: type II toxin-antitoxin system RelE/ParE family toxin [Actinobacteria bacterium]|nr:type II toxin-antitoxin system RelE/ParE family toxin [Actinomycetota bacterium]
MYKIRYLPIAQKDLQDIVLYILKSLKSPKVAMDFIDILDKSILRLKQYPYSSKLYQPQEPLGTEYRFLPVKNYLIFYIVTENTVEIHRIIYAKMDLEKLIK